MPKIPQLQQGQRMQPNAPVQIDDSRDARMVGNAISQAGAGLTDLGQGVTRFAQAQEQEKLLQATTNSKTQAELNAIQIKEKVLSSSSPDGSDYLQNFVTTWDEQNTPYFDSISDEKERQIAKQQFDGVKLSLMKDIAKEAQVLSAKHKEGQADRQRANRTMIIEKDPGKAADHWLEWNEYVKASPAISPERKATEMQSSAVDFSDAAINSYLRQGKHKDAKAVLNGPLAQYMTPKEREERIKKIEDYQVHKLQVSNTIEKLHEEREKRHLTRIQTAEEDRLTVLAMEAKGNPDKVALVEEEIRNSVEAGLLDPTSRKSVLGALDRGTRQQSLSQRFESGTAMDTWMEKIHTTPLRKLSDLKEQLRNDPTLIPQDRMRLTAAVNKEMEERKNPPKRKSGRPGVTTAQEMSQSMQYIKDIYTPGMDFDGSGKRMVADKRMELVETVKRTGRSPLEVAREMVNRDHPRGLKGLLPELEDDGRLKGPITKERIKIWVAENEKLFKAGLITEKEREERAIRAQQGLQLKDMLDLTEQENTK